MIAPPLNVLYYGREDPPPEQRHLRAGHLSATFEQGQLLNIRWRGQEVVHRIYAAVRDRDWGTVPVRIFDLSIREDLSTFALTFDARHKENDIDFVWAGRIETDGSGRLSFSMEGEALSTFLRSRIGFCVSSTIARANPSGSCDRTVPRRAACSRKRSRWTRPSLELKP
jgi:D-apionolactonase